MTPNTGTPAGGERIGLLGGTFDPIHTAHLFIAEEARTRLGLRRVLFVPNGRPPHKRDGRASAAHRLAMVELAVRDNPAFAVSRIEVDRHGPSYAVDTLRQLRAETSGAEFVFIVGYDTVPELVTWHEHQALFELCTFAAVSRTGVDRAELEALPEPLRRRVELLESPALGISSTEIRQRVRDGLPIRYLVPDTVLEFIHTHGLYTR